ncbi:hypothetical protein ACFL20_01955 [Spirochaetota bacterium]
MSENDNNDFDSLFDDIESDISGENDKKNNENNENDLFSFDEEISDEKAAPAQTNVIATPEIPKESIPDNKKKRSSLDFEPDMDAILITAQSSMVIEGMKLLTTREFAPKTRAVYAEAIKGIDLYIKIIQRNPNNYQKMSTIISEDLDSKEVEKFAITLYKKIYDEFPDTDSQKLRAFEIFRNQLKIAFNKADISYSKVKIKKYYLQSGGLDENKIANLIKIKDKDLMTDVSKLNNQIKIAKKLLDKGNTEISKGLRSRDINIFIINASDLLYYYYNNTANLKLASYYKKLNENYKKYYLIR